MPKSFPIPLRPMANRLLALRGLQLGPVAWSGFEADIFAQLSPGRIENIFDVGANVGQSVEAFCKFFPDAHLFCFEPTPETFRALETNARMTSKKVTLFNLALGSQGGTAEMFINKANSQLNKVSIASSVDQARGPEFLEVPVSTIDLICDAHEIKRIDILKTDTEGHDLQVLRGAQTMLKGSIRAVICEVGFGEHDDQHTPFAEIFDDLRSYGFHFRGLYGSVYNEAGVIEYANSLFTL